jgi:transposase
VSDLFWLTDEQVERLRPFCPKSHGKPRVDDRRVLPGIVFLNKNGLRWRVRRAAMVHPTHSTIGGNAGARQAWSRA